jgi:hypothetical protein
MGDTEKTDAELCVRCPTLEPEWTRGQEKAEAVMKQFQAEHFKPLLKTLSDAMTEHLWNLLRDYLLQDTESNLQGHMRDRIERSVQALLGAEQWAVDKYVMGKYSEGKQIRAKLAALIPKDIQDARIQDLNAEIVQLKDDLQRERDRNARR